MQTFIFVYFFQNTTDATRAQHAATHRASDHAAQRRLNDPIFARKKFFDERRLTDVLWSICEKLRKNFPPRNLRERRGEDEDQRDAREKCSDEFIGTRIFFDRAAAAGDASCIPKVCSPRAMRRAPEDHSANIAYAEACISVLRLRSPRHRHPDRAALQFPRRDSTASGRRSSLRRRRLR